VQYILLIYPDDQSWAALAPEEQASVTGEYLALRQRPEFVEGHRLEGPQATRTVRVRDGQTLATDGPFAETAEVMAGYYLVEAEDEAAAVEFAARIPAARMGGAVEVRPVVAITTYS
jgi:hypothetical protein